MIQTSAIMVKHCIHGTCNSDTRYSHLPHMKDVRFIPFPKPTTEIARQRAVKWIAAIQHPGFTLEKIKRSTYLCSKHFFGEKGPTVLNPDPLPVISNAIIKDVDKPRKTSEKRFRTDTTRRCNVTKISVNQDPNANTSRQETKMQDANFSFSLVSVATQTSASLVNIATQTREVKSLITTTQMPETVGIRSEKESQTEFFTPENMCQYVSNFWAMSWLEGKMQLVHIINSIAILIITVEEKTNEFICKIMVRSNELPPIHPFWEGISVKSLKDVRQLLAKAEKWNTCTSRGQGEKPFVRCQLFSPSNVCNHCKMTLKYAKERRKPVTLMKKYQNIRFLNRDDLIQRFRTVSKKLHAVNQVKNRLKLKVKELTNSKEHSLLENDNYDFGKSLSQHENSGPDELLHLFLHQQLKASSVRKPSGMKWHPLIIKWAVQLKQKSASAYREVKNSGFIRLPSERTLSSYKSIVNTTQGSFDGEVAEKL